MIPKKLTRRKLLGKDAQERFHDFLYTQIPEFVAPTDMDTWPDEAARLRRESLEKVYLRGYDPEQVAATPKVVKGEVLTPDPAYTITKLRYEIYPNYWIPGLLYEPTNLTGKVPVVLNPNGHHWGGKAVTYKQARCINLAKRGMIALNMEFIGMGELQADVQHNNLTWLDLTGMAGVGLFYLALSKGLDVLLAHPCADHDRTGLTGLSGGGWQTIVLGALDERVKVIVPVAGYTAIRERVHCQRDIGDAEQVPSDMVKVADYQYLTAMLAPRATLQIMNSRDDCCFRTGRTKPVIYDAIKPTFAAFGALSRFRYHNNRVPGTHNYDADNRMALYRFLNRHFGLKEPLEDLHDETEILTEEVLNVGLPAEQERFQTIALARARELAQLRTLPETADERDALRKRLREVLRLPEYTATWEHLGDEGVCSTWMVRMAHWQIPLIAHTGDEASGLQLSLDEGGIAYSDRWTWPEDRQTLVADFLGGGENRLSSPKMLLLACVGARALGIQVAQILAVATSANEALGQRMPLHLWANGYGQSLAALLAAALAPGLFESLTLRTNLTSLVHLLEWATPFEACPAAFCFGLLEVADIKEMTSLLEDTTLIQPHRCIADQQY